MTDTNITGSTVGLKQITEVSSTNPWRFSEHPGVVSSLTIAGLFVLWFLATNLNWVDTLFLPAPQQLFESLITLFSQGYIDTTLGQHISASLMRVLSALTLSLITAISLGIFMGLNPIVRAVFAPLIDFYRPIPPLAYLPLIVIWFGIGEFSKILLIFLAIFAPLVISSAESVRRIDSNRIQAVRCLGASRFQVIRFVVLPSIFPDLVTGLRIALGMGWSTLVAAELIAANHGLGFMVQSASQFLATDVVIAGILLIALIALVIELGLRRVQKQFANWSIYDHRR